MDFYGWLLLKLVFLDLTGQSLGAWMFVMDAKSENQWKQQTIPIWISPAYRSYIKQQIFNIMKEFQNKTNIRFRRYLKERDDSYISLKITTYGCYGLLGYGKGGERWINLHEECFDYKHAVLRSVYQILGFQMIAVENPPASMVYTGVTSKPIYIKFEVWKDKLIIDGRTSKQENIDECIKAETATGMSCHQPNMEFHYWNKVYENLIHSFPYVDTLVTPNITRKDKPFLQNYRYGEKHDFFHVDRVYNQKNNDPAFNLFDAVVLYVGEEVAAFPGVIRGVSDIYCDDLLLECDFLENAREHCTAYQEFRYILCARTCQMCGVSLRMYYISTHHPFVYAQTKKEDDLPICRDEPEAVKKGQCDRGNLHSCLLPSFREKCRRSCGYCSEQSRVDCGFVRGIHPEYFKDHPNYNYRCQYIRAISLDTCASDEIAVVNPITDCMLSCGRYICSENIAVEEDRGHEQVPVMELYVPQKGWKFATFASLKHYETKG